MLPVTPKPGVEIVYKRFSRLPRGGIVCTVSYLKSKEPIPAPAKRETLWVRITGVLSRFRGAMWAGFNRAKQVLH
jgi:hypothetical protein